MTGPQFLLVYVFTAVLVTIALRHARAWFGETTASEIDTNDPYRIAFLRGGIDEALRLAVVHMIDGEWLVADVKTGELRLGTAPQRPSHTLEWAIYDDLMMQEPKRSYELLKNERVIAWSNEMIARLQADGTYANAADRKTRNVLAAVGALVLIVVAILRLEVAAQHARTNTGLLWFLMFVAPPLSAYFVTSGARSTRGDQLLENLRMLLPNTPRSANSASGRLLSPELLLVGAVFGIEVLESVGIASARALFPPPPSSGGSGCSSSGCGGGGCGGGCGGCGG